MKKTSEVPLTISYMGCLFTDLQTLQDFAPWLSSTKFYIISEESVYGRK